MLSESGLNRGVAPDEFRGRTKHYMPAYDMHMSIDTKLQRRLISL
jgi:hypothetical protein